MEKEGHGKARGYLEFLVNGEMLIPSRQKGAVRGRHMWQEALGCIEWLVGNLPSPPTCCKVYDSWAFSSCSPWKYIMTCKPRAHSAQTVLSQWLGLEERHWLSPVPKQDSISSSTRLREHYGRGAEIASWRLEKNAGKWCHLDTP